MTSRNHPSRKVITFWLVVICTVINVCIYATHAEAESDTDLFAGINYAYATWVGTGYYSLGDRRALILRGRWATPLLESLNRHKWELDLLLQGTIGFYDTFADFNEVAAITVVPGLMLKYQIRENWWLKPFGQIGIGKDFAGGDTALIGAAGIKSLAAFPRANGAVWELGNSLMFADNSKSDENLSDDGFSMFEIGINRRTPLAYRVLEQATRLNIFFIYTEFINDVEFFQVDYTDKRLKRIFKFGVAFTAEEKFSILGFKIGGGGMHVSLGDNYLGIGLNTGFPF